MDPWPKDQTNPLLHPPPFDVNSTIPERNLSLLTETLDLSPHPIAEQHSSTKQESMKQIRSKISQALHLHGTSRENVHVQRVSAEHISTPPPPSNRPLYEKTPFYPQKQEEEKLEAPRTAAATTTPSITQEEEEKLEASAAATVHVPTPPISIAKSIHMPLIRDVTEKHDLAPRSLSEPQIASGALEQMVKSLVKSSHLKESGNVSMEETSGEEETAEKEAMPMCHIDEKAATAAAHAAETTTDTTGPSAGDVGLRGGYAETMTPSVSGGAIVEESPKEPPPSPTPELATHPPSGDQQKKKDRHHAGAEAQQQTMVMHPATPAVVGSGAHPPTPLGALDTPTIPFVEVPVRFFVYCDSSSCYNDAFIISMKHAKYNMLIIHSKVL